MILIKGQQSKHYRYESGPDRRSEKLSVPFCLVYSRLAMVLNLLPLSLCLFGESIRIFRGVFKY